MKVTIVGAGNVGSTLGGTLLRNGTDVQVKYGVRNTVPEKHTRLLEEQPQASIASVHDAIEWADAVILATSTPTSKSAYEEFSKSLGSGVKDKVIIDATNPLTPYPGLELWTEGNVSGGEILSSLLPESYVFKAFNTLGFELMSVGDGSTMPGFTGQRLTMLIAGPKDKRQVAERIVELVGFEPCYVGPIRYARNLEAIAELWIHVALEGIGPDITWGRNFHFQVVGDTEKV